MKKYFFFLFLLTLPICFCFAQNEESEILSWTSRNKVSGNKLSRTDTITIQINSRSGFTFFIQNLFWLIPKLFGKPFHLQM